MSKDVLGAITTELKNSDHNLDERTWVYYYLPGMELGAGWWATAHFGPDLRIKISGVSAEEEKSLVSRTETHGARPTIGRWLDDSSTGGSISIYRENGKLYVEQIFKDGSKSKSEAIESRSPRGRRFEAKERSFSEDHYVIDSQGDLEIRDREGLILVAKKIDSLGTLSQPGQHHSPPEPASAQTAEVPTPRPR